MGWEYNPGPWVCGRFCRGGARRATRMAGKSDENGRGEAMEKTRYIRMQA